MVIKMAAEEICNGRPEIRFSNCRMAANTEKTVLLKFWFHMSEVLQAGSSLLETVIGTVTVLLSVYAVLINKFTNCSTYVIDISLKIGE
jgi:hypothetical protein